MIGRVLLLLFGLLGGARLVGRLRMLSPKEPMPEKTVPPIQVEYRGLTYRHVRQIALMVIFLVLGVIFALWLAGRISEVLIVLAVALLMSTALRPTVNRISRARLPGLNRNVPRPMAILLIYAALLLVLLGTLLLVVPRVAREVSNLAAQAPEYASRVDSTLDDLRGTYPWIPELEDVESQVVPQLAGSVSQLPRVLVFAVNVVSGVFSGVLVLVLTFLLLMEGDKLFKHILFLLPKSQRGTAQKLGGTAGNKVESWLRGVLLLSAFIGVFTSIGMWLIGMPYPLLLGLIAGLCEPIPMIGATLGAIPAVTVALFQSPAQLALVVVFVFVLQQLENNLLVPAVMGSQLELSPLLTILSVLIGASLLGIIGALLAIPVAAILQVVWLDVIVPWVKGSHDGPSP